MKRKKWDGVSGSKIQKVRRKKVKKSRDSPRGSNVRHDLLPGVPNEVVSMHILPRLPWYQRPVMTSVSKLWKATVLGSAMELRGRSAELLKRTPGGVVLLLCSRHFPTLEYFDLTLGTWQDLPPLPGSHEKARIKDIFSVDGSLYVVYSDGSLPVNLWSNDLYKMEISAGLWFWEHITPTSIQGAVEAARLSEEGVELVGRRHPSVFVHEVIDGDDLTVCRYETVPFARLCIYDLSYQSPRGGYARYTLPVNISETQFYIVRAFRYLEYHDRSMHKEWTVISEVDLRRKLKMQGKERVVALTSSSASSLSQLERATIGDRLVYLVTLVLSKAIGNLRLWRGCGGGHDPGEFEWKLLSSVNRPVEPEWEFNLHNLVRKNFQHWDAVRLHVL